MAEETAVFCSAGLHTCVLVVTPISRISRILRVPVCTMYVNGKILNHLKIRCFKAIFRSHIHFPTKYLAICKHFPCTFKLSYRGKPVVSHTSRFAYIEVVSPTRPWSIRIHRSRFAYIEKKRSHKHSNRIAIGQRNKFNLKRRYARVVIMCRALFLFGTANALTARTLSSNLIRVSSRFVTTRWSIGYTYAVDSLHIRSKHNSRFATET